MRARGRAEIRAATADQLGRLVRVLDPQRVRLLLVPVETGGIAVDAQAQVVLVARADLARDEHAARAVVEAQERGAVVVELAARDDAVQVRTELRRAQIRDELGEMKRVHADVAHAARESRALRIEPPYRLFLAAALDRLGKPALRVLDE